LVYIRRNTHENKSQAFNDILWVEYANEGSITLVTQIGTMPTHKELKEIADGINKFLEVVDEESVYIHNDRKKKEYQEEWVKLNEGYYNYSNAKKPKEKDGSYGYVYFIKEYHSNTTKIGRTINLPSRTNQFAAKLPFDWDYVRIVQCDNNVLLEESLHKNLIEKRVNGEWFDVDANEIDAALTDTGILFEDVLDDWRDKLARK
jgi:hypothetical protein